MNDSQTPEPHGPQPMTDAALLAELARRHALIVHCSRPGKADEGAGALLFPDDLQKAIRICATESSELCCSVIWPSHVATFGTVGIILKPRSTRSITSICTTDGGTYLDQTTGKRVGAGVPFSPQGVMDTFARATDYNEWNVQDAETIGIFVHPGEPWEVARKCFLSEIPGYDPSIGDEEIIGAFPISPAQIAAQFPGLPILTVSGTGIARLGETGLVPVSALDLYGLAENK
jgi:hypothetical protein